MALMPKKRRAFTLTEMLVTTMLLTLLASLALTNYTRTVENAKATAALAKADAMAHALRMYNVDRRSWLSAPLAKPATPAPALEDPATCSDAAISA